MSKLAQVDFYPNGKIVKHYGEHKVESNVDTKRLSPKEQLKLRLKEYKKNKSVRS